MKYNNNAMTPIHLFNIIGLAGICVSLIVAFYYQLVMDELPCPLCLLQRVGLIIVGFGFLFNVFSYPRGVNYGIIISGCILTGIMASRQMFLHIMPGDTGYGSTFLGLHFYTWALITSVLLIAFVAVLISISSMKTMVLPLNFSPILFRIVGWLFLSLIAANLISTVLECGDGQCADNPITYELLSK